MSKKRDGRSQNKPPKEYQFKKGQSGNPNGRPPKKRIMFEDDINDVFSEFIAENKQGDPITARRALITRLRNDALNGDKQSMRMCIPLLKVMDNIPHFEKLPEDDLIMKNFTELFDGKGEIIDKSKVIEHRPNDDSKKGGQS